MTRSLGRRGPVVTRLLLAVASTLAALALLVALVFWLNVRGDADTGTPAQTSASPTSPTAALAPADLIERGRYLALAGDCAACHTRRGGAPYAGGRAIETPFGAVYSSNLTPDARSGLGSWTADDFWRALHNGRSRSGRLLVPAFPYPNYSVVARADADALFAYLRSLPAAPAANREHELQFPFNTQAALAIWRALYFRAGSLAPRPDKSAAWNRGAYLVRGLGHCDACHAARNALGATERGAELAGGVIPVQNWYAPSLAALHEAGVARWSTADVVRLLKAGVSAQSVVLGPMADVVFNSTQFLHDEDLHAIAVYLQQLPPVADAAAAQSAPTPSAPDAGAAARGSVIYKDHCASCHGAAGEGAWPAYPALAGSRKLMLASAANLVHVVVEGGFAPATAGNPRPYGMPPFGQTLSNAQVADVLSYVRSAWGNSGAPVSAIDVLHVRARR